MSDIIYFGYTWEEDSWKLEQEFITTVKEKFPNIKLTDAYDSIKGYRQEVEIEKESEEDFYAWLIANGWFNCSIHLQLLAMTNTEILNVLIRKAKRDYPELLKQEQ